MKAMREGARRPSDDELKRSTPPHAGGREVRIGLFVILGLFGVLMVLFLLTDPATFRGRYMIHTEVTDAGGLRSGDPVQMRGVNIGRVHGFELTQEGVEITLELEGRWAIPRDSHTRLASGDLLGGRTVEIIPGAAPESLEPGDRIPGTATEGVFDMAEELGGEARAILEQVRQLFSDPTIDAVQQSVLDLHDLTETLSRTAENQRGELERLTASLNRSAEGIEAASAAGPDVARAVARADSILSELQETGATVQGTALTLEELLARVNRGEGTLGQLSANDDLYRNLNQAAESFMLLAEDIRENPGRYLRFRLF